MKKVTFWIHIIAVIVILLSTSGCDATTKDNESSASSSGGVSVTGTALVGGYRFASMEGDLSAVYNSDNYEVVPPGAVLVVIKGAYCIGYFDAGAYYMEQARKVMLAKVFFVIYPSGKLEFHYPSATDSRFFGDKIMATVSFD